MGIQGMGRMFLLDRGESMSESDQKSLARYVSEYLAEERERGNPETDDWLIWNAINAWFGGAR